MLRNATLMLSATTVVVGQPPCTAGVFYDGPDVSGSPFSIVDDHKADGQDCSFMCNQRSDCRAFNWAPQGTCGPLTCSSPNGCCWLKRGQISSLNMTSTPKGCGCAMLVRPDPSSLPPAPSPAPIPPAGAKNVLYILVDDLRPDLAPFGASWMSTPNIQALAQAPGSVTFNRAYCNIAVCSPSRMSFLSGRYPAHTKTWNFLNHMRQAECAEVPNTKYANASTYKVVDLVNGGAGQCCSLCTADGSGVCAGWTYTAAGRCQLHATLNGAASASVGDVSGLGSGGTVGRGWVTLPQHFKQSGYLTMGTGKIFHTEEGGAGPAPWDGYDAGMPPLQDPPSWSYLNGVGFQGFNGSMSNVNAFAPMRNCLASEQAPGSNSVCSVNATSSGDVPMDVFRLEDRIISDDALLKLNAGYTNYKSSGQPFFLAVGFRKPHLPFKHPAPYDALYADPSNITLAKYQTMDPSVPPIAFHETSTGGYDTTPWKALPAAAAGLTRRDYYSAISWTDYCIGRVLKALEQSGLTNDTAIVFHADHGWSLGEYGEWQKFTNWEFGTRVPLVISAPWLSQPKVGEDAAVQDGETRERLGAGAITQDIAQLIDIYPTLSELAGVPAPPSYQLDGLSLVPALQSALRTGGRQRQTDQDADKLSPADMAVDDSATGAGSGGNTFALSMYPRCPADVSNASMYWADNDCMLVERSLFPFMGVSLRTDRYRYTEWLQWNGTSLSPLWDAPLVGMELYDHEGDDGTTFDGPYEVVNHAGDPAYAAQKAQLAAMLRQVYPQP